MVHGFSLQHQCEFHANAREVESAMHLMVICVAIILDDGDMISLPV